MANKQPKVGSPVTLLQHGLRYAATVTEESEDGSLVLRAIAINNGQPFTVSRVQPAPKDHTASSAPYWTTEPEAPAPNAPTPTSADKGGDK